jgi:hypothetical protein
MFVLFRSNPQLSDARSLTSRTIAAPALARPYALVQAVRPFATALCAMAPGASLHYLLSLLHDAEVFLSFAFFFFSFNFQYHWC